MDAVEDEAAALAMLSLVYPSAPISLLHEALQNHDNDIRKTLTMLRIYSAVENKAVSVPENECPTPPHQEEFHVDFNLDDYSSV